MALNKNQKINLTGFDDLFSTEEQRQDELREKVMEIPLNELHSFKNHPFKVKDDEKMQDTVDSIKEHGVLMPAIVRERAKGGYEIISGHRRHHASGLAGLETLPSIIRDLDDDQATIIMVDSNLQREELLPSERAFSYKMKLDAMKRQAGRPRKKNGGQIVHHLKARDEMAKELNESGRQIQRYVRLTNLNSKLLDMVDNKELAFNPAVEISYLKEEEQKNFIEAMDSEQCTPSLSQAQRLKKLSAENKCTFEVICVVLGEEKKSDIDTLKFKVDKEIKDCFPPDYTPKQMQDTMKQLLKDWAKNRNQNITKKQNKSYEETR